MSIEIWFDVDAGKFDGGLKNIKYCDTLDNPGDAATAYNSVKDYPWAHIEVCVRQDNVTVRHMLVRNYPEWRDVWHDFHSDVLSWTQAFEALQNKCGMSVEQALECLAMHFERRPVFEATEV